MTPEQAVNKIDDAIHVLRDIREDLLDENYVSIQVDLPDETLVLLARRSFETGLPCEDILRSIIVTAAERAVNE